MKVYGWIGNRRDCPENPNGNNSRQVRYIVAAQSWAAAHRAIPADQHESLGHMKRYGSVTGNEHEIAQAMTKPGTAFWIPLWQDHQLLGRQWKEA